MQIRDRIKELRRVPASELLPNPKNWRIHPIAQQDALRGVLAEVGYADALIARETPEGLMLVDGHLRAETTPDADVPVLVLDIDEAEADLMLATLDPLAAMAGRDEERLSELLSTVSSDNDTVNALLQTLANGYEPLTLLEPVEDPGPQIDRADELREKWQTERGQVWEVGRHRLMCGDSTDAHGWRLLCGDNRAVLCHADPPYGMNKDMENDNLHASNLDAFQMRWWLALRPVLEDNATVYIWGKAEDLWRLWYVGGLKDSERLTFRNEVVWNKGHGEGMGSDAHRMYATASERCLFFMLGEQGFNNNADNYWEGWDGVVDYLRGEKEKTGWDIAKFKRLAGHSETSGCHWFDKSQWTFPTKEVYESWQVEAREHDAFKREHDAFKREYDELKREFYSTRASFDNTHDNMTDVWQFHRVGGDDRWEHETPKPVEMVQRVVKSSAPKGKAMLDPFLGSGTTMVAAEQLGRICYGMEIEPKYVAVTLERMAGMGLEPKAVKV